MEFSYANDGRTLNASEETDKSSFLNTYVPLGYGYPEFGLKIDIDEKSKSQCGVDRLRETHFRRLKGRSSEEQDELEGEPTLYFDHIGSALHSEVQLREATEHLNRVLYGNPHSLSMSGVRSTQVINEARNAILDFFGTDTSRYSVIFTSGCTGSLKLVGETFPWTDNISTFYYTIESHNSLIGIREYAAEANCHFSCVDDVSDLVDVFNQMSAPLFGETSTAFHLVGVPLESNFSGAKVHLKELDRLLTAARKLRETSRNFPLVLVDCASYVPTSGGLNLSIHEVDFVAFSFYKMFGFPSGLGALLVRKGVESHLSKTYFGGGTVTASLSNQRYHRLREGISERFEDGTLPFLSVVSLTFGFRLFQQLGIENIKRHTHSLYSHLYELMRSLVHRTGVKLCTFYGNHERQRQILASEREGSSTGDKEDYYSLQGPVIAFNLNRPDGQIVGYREVEQLASLNGIHLRSGCFCNPGACQKYLNLSDKEVTDNLEAGHICWDDKDILNGKHTGAVRISLGYMSTYEDVTAFIKFLRVNFLDSRKLDISNGISSISSETGITEHLEKIYVYPIKSCGRFEVDEWNINQFGLEFDREWVLIDSDGRYINQKTAPKMCLIRPEIDLKKKELRVFAAKSDLDDVLILSLDFWPIQSVVLSVCGDNCVGLVYEGEVNRWFRQHLGKEARLVRMKQEKSSDFRNVDSENVASSATIGPSSFTPSERTSMTRQTKTATATQQAECSISFTNESQFLIVNSESVRELERRLSDKNASASISAVNFRPNLVILGKEPFEEDRWSEVRIGDQFFKIGGPCNRCRMICIDQDTGEENKEPLLTLSTYRREKGKIFFGVHADHQPNNSLSRQRIRRSDPVYVTT
eukprot:TRINITY_DN7625_c0_g1_i3.p1 TRINITY_DN7625_c0_g1~~TRINITY_DN7625_c0_g1_i3.p1  ORF type:complete len:869 (+),score=141.41 TRINITY_DN7625_c0_g1_i3:95-2701(+)